MTGRWVYVATAPGRSGPRLGGGATLAADGRAFSPRARHDMVEAQRQAAMLDHSHIGTEHVLLGILAGPGPTAELLGALGVRVEGACPVVDAVGDVRPGTEARPRSPPRQARARTGPPARARPR
ncbi:MAG: Clp protease N-terminal domain-containing protein [Acidimicrobiales bacterium]